MFHTKSLTNRKGGTLEDIYMGMHTNSTNQINKAKKQTPHTTYYYEESLL